jgi:hypothetical protein
LNSRRSCSERSVRHASIWAMVVGGFMSRR